MRRYPLALWAGIVFSIALSASAMYWDATRVVLSNDSEWATIARVNSEYRAATRAMRLPQGRVWPEATPFSGTAPDGATNTYAAGFGTEWAEWYWFDAWAVSAVSPAKSAADRQAALDQLPAFYKTTAFSTAEDPGYFRRTIAAAQSGDLAALRLYVDSLDPMSKGEE